jgi:hypothetical protein
LGEVLGDHANHPRYDEQITARIDQIFAENNSVLKDSFDDLIVFVNNLKSQIKSDVIDGTFIVNTLIIP